MAMAGASRHDDRAMTPEERARQGIDRKLEAAGWVVQDFRRFDPRAGLGIAVREYPTDTGPADYALFVDRQAVDIIEAKRDEAGENLTATERQTERYAFFRPELLAEWQKQPETLRRRLAVDMPSLPTRNLRDCQVTAVTGLERSLATNHPRALVHMATGAGKTFTAITSVCRLLKYGGAKRILFLVDTRNLGKQAHQEFMAYSPPDDGRNFTELYNVQRLASSRIDPHAQVCISTIQRMYSILSGEPIDESAEDVSLNEVRQTGAQSKFVARIVDKLEELLADLDAGVAELKAAQKKLAKYRQSLVDAALTGALTSMSCGQGDTQTWKSINLDELFCEMAAERL